MRLRDPNPDKFSLDSFFKLAPKRFDIDWQEFTKITISLEKFSGLFGRKSQDRKKCACTWLATCFQNEVSSEIHKYLPYGTPRVQYVVGISCIRFHCSDHPLLFPYAKLAVRNVRHDIYSHLQRYRLGLLSNI